MTAREVDQRAERAATAHGARVVARLGVGTDNVAYALDDGSVLRLRQTLDDEARDAVAREAALLELLADQPAVPAPRVRFVDAAVGALALERLPGTSLLDRPAADPLPLVPALGDLLAALHALTSVAAPVVVREEADLGEHLEEAQELLEVVGSLVPVELRERLQAQLATDTPAPGTDLRLCHADLGAEHLLAEPGPWRLTGVLDWTDAAITDPALDLARLWRDLGRPVAEAVAARLGLDDAALERAVVLARCMAVEDLAFGHETGDPRYVAAALAALTRL